VHDLNVVGIAASPDEADAPLVIDANTVLAPAIALEGYQLVAGRGLQVFKDASPMQIEQLPAGRALECPEAPDRHVVEQGRCVLAPERPDHEITVLRMTS
jgi:hypothetical protein